MNPASSPPISFLYPKTPTKPSLPFPTMRDWDHFIKQTSWFLKPDEIAIVGEGKPWSRSPVAGLPHLSALLASATLTPVSVSDREYELLAWGPPSARQGWLCHPPPEASSGQVYPIHSHFWSVCGGIVERFGKEDCSETEGQDWWLNQNEILTVSATEVSVSELLDAYSWIWEEEGLTIPIAPEEYYVVAVEANANLTLVHRESGKLILFAPDPRSRVSRFCLGAQTALFLPLIMSLIWHPGLRTVF